MTREQLIEICDPGYHDDVSPRMAAWSRIVGFLRDVQDYRDTCEFIAHGSGDTRLNKPGNRYHGHYLHPQEASVIRAAVAEYGTAVQYLVDDGEYAAASPAEAREAICHSIESGEADID